MPPQAADQTRLIPTIGYIRVSWLQEHQISPDIQRHAIDDWARRNGRTIVEWIEDLDVTGRDFRRKVMQAIQGIEAGRAQEIAVWKYSRFGRTDTGNAVNLGRIHLAGGELQSATEDVDASTAVGKLTRNMLMDLAVFESDRAGEQWKEAHANRRARGLPSNGRGRFGYILRGRVRDPFIKHRTVRAPEDGVERYEIDPRTGPILTELYRRYTAGAGFRSLAGWLNNAGIYGTRGIPWSDVSMMDVLDAGFGAGLLRVHDVNCGCHTSPTCRNMILVEGAHDPVISNDEWRAYRRRRERVARTAPRARVTVYPLTGLTRCGHCHSTMTIRSERGVPGRVYMCGGYLRKSMCAARSVRRGALEDAVLGALAQWADDLEKQNVPAEVPHVELQVDERAIQAEIDTADAALVRLTLQMAKGLIPEPAYVASRDELLADRASAKKRLEEAARPQPQRWTDYVPVIRTLVEEWPTLAAAARREMLADVVRVVRVFRDSRTSSRIEVESLWGDVHTVSR